MSYETEAGILQILGSRDAVRHAMEMSLIENGEVWMDMIDSPNQTSHVYDEEMARDVMDEIINTYYPVMRVLQESMVEI